MPTYFWDETVDTASCIANPIVISPRKTKTPYNIWKGIEPSVSYFNVSGYKCFILTSKDNL